MNSHEIAVVVQPSDIDGLGHVNNLHYVRWMQEAATAHWEAAAPESLRSRISWVVTRHEVDYKAPAFEGERLVIRTWVGQPSGATWERFIEVRREADDRVLARGRSLYAALDAGTGRPRRVDAELRFPFEGA
jgi:acyl-CoA thioester hydrolase